ncbi:uncharacterized protein LOC128963262 [Oppia nitens]|uniref:uncharacterized protein LOC128963262 n=1 Tax=Oppia nitens TaxID=1686743 RepID=UPI0023D9A791|nr:uncharacterized protein LOC128963262 [Oppia nitens]
MGTALIHSKPTSDPFHVLAFWVPSGDEAHVNFVNEANKWFPAQGSAHGYTYTATNNMEQMTVENMRRYQVILFLDDVHYAMGNDEHRAFEQYVENGGGWMGFHVSAFNDNPNEWPWFFNTFLGTGRFKSNTWWPTKIHYHIDSPNHQTMNGLPNKFDSSVNEWYAWEKDLRRNPDIEILASVDNSSFPVGTDPNQSWYSGYYPVIWSMKKFRAIYCNFGHNNMDYAHHRNTSWTFAARDQDQFLFNALNYLANR